MEFLAVVIGTTLVAVAVALVPRKLVTGVGVVALLLLVVVVVLVSACRARWGKHWG